MTKIQEGILPNKKKVEAEQIVILRDIYYQVFSDVISQLNYNIEKIGISVIEIERTLDYFIKNMDFFKKENENSFFNILSRFNPKSGKDVTALLNKYSDFYLIPFLISKYDVNIKKLNDNMEFEKVKLSISPNIKYDGVPLFKTKIGFGDFTPIQGKNKKVNIISTIICFSISKALKYENFGTAFNSVFNKTYRDLISSIKFLSQDFIKNSDVSGISIKQSRRADDEILDSTKTITPKDEKLDGKLNYRDGVATVKYKKEFNKTYDEKENETNEVPISEWKTAIHFLDVTIDDRFDVKIKYDIKDGKLHCDTIEFDNVLNNDEKQVQSILSNHLKSATSVNIIPSPKTKFTLSFVVDDDLSHDMFRGKKMVSKRVIEKNQDGVKISDRIITTAKKMIYEIVNFLKKEMTMNADKSAVKPSEMTLSCVIIKNVIIIQFSKIKPNKTGILSKIFGSKDDIYKKLFVTLDSIINKETIGKKVLQENKNVQYSKIINCIIYDFSDIQ